MKCTDLKKDSVYRCDDCGLEVKVVTECNDTEDTDCCSSTDKCNFICCGKELTLK